MDAHRSPDTAERPTAGRLGAIIPAGGRARRLGGTPKPLLRDRTGTALITRTLAALLEAGAAPEYVVVVGDADILAEDIRAVGAAGRAVRVVREDPPFSGPAAAIAAGVQALIRSAPDDGPPPLTFVLAADMPHLAPGLRAMLHAAAAHPEVDCWMGRSHNSTDDSEAPRREHLFALHRTEALGRRIAETETRDTSVRRLLRGLRIHLTDLPAGAAEDVDTWAAVAAHGLRPPR